MGYCFFAAHLCVLAILQPKKEPEFTEVSGLEYVNVLSVHVDVWLQFNRLALVSCIGMADCSLIDLHWSQVRNS